MGSRGLSLSKRRHRLLVGGLLSAVIVAQPVPVLSQGRAFGSRSRATCPTSWSVISSPNIGAFTNELFGSAAISASDAWAVGDYLTTASGPSSTLTEHWDGSAWSVISSPNVAGGNNVFRAVAALSTSDVWAVGTAWNAVDFAQHTLIEHWTGAAWAIVASPNASTSNNVLYAVTPVSSTDIWATGYYQINGGNPKTLAEHWDGTTWTVVSTPTGGSFLFGATGISSNDVWGVGVGTGTLTEQWNGSAWAVVPSPSVGSSYNVLNAASAIGSSDVWAVGNYDTSNPAPFDQTLTEHWDGAAWSVIPSSSPGSYFNELLGSTALGTDDVWAAGLTSMDAFSSATLIEHWDGMSWTTVSSPSLATNNQLLGMSSSGDTLWAVGRDGPTGTWSTLIEESCPAPTPTVTSFQPPGGTVGKSVTITGSGFTGATAVTFDGVAASFTVTSDTSITATVPNGALTGPIAVTTPGGTATSATNFLVRPKITSFTPTSGPVGTQVHISGSAFTGATQVTFNGLSASFTVLSYSKISATVPVGATTGPIGVATNGGTGKSKRNFTVT